jgi:hypothetical protein
MKTFETIPVLNRLLAILCRSLPAYLADARPWTRIGRHEIQTLLDRLAADQQKYARRVANAISQRGARPDAGRFPAEFTAKNDLALDFLFREVVAHQEHDVAMIERCAAELETAPPLHALAEEILGNARGHLDILLEKMQAEEGK